MKKLFLNIVLILLVIFSSAQISDERGVLLLDGKIIISNGNILALGEKAYPDILLDGNTVAWFDYQKSVIKDGSDLVSVWGDNSGLDHHLLQSVEAKQPTLTSNEILFDGIDNILQSDLFALEKPEIVYMVVNQKSWNANDYIFDGKNINSGRLQQLTTTPFVIASAGSGNSNLVNLHIDRYSIVRVQFGSTGEISEIIVNDNIAKAFPAGVIDMDGITLGSRGGAGGSYSNIGVKEKIVRTIDEGDYDEITIYEYLKEKYAINDFYFPLPTDGLVISVGDTYSLYGDAIVNIPIDNSLVVDYTCDIGVETGNDYSITPLVGDIGIHSMQIDVSDGVISESHAINIEVKAKQVALTKSILSVGNSLTYLGFNDMASEINTSLSDWTITYLGTRGTTYKHEGISGSSWYSLITREDSPFTKSGVLDIPAYFTDNTITTPDLISFRLGVNDMFAYNEIPATDLNMRSIVIYMKTFIDGFLAFDANLKILISLPTTSCSTYSGWQSNYGTGVENQNRYNEQIHRYYKYIVSEFSGGIYDTRVNVSYEAINLDRNDGYPKTEGEHSNALHPNTSGYEDLGNGFAAYINNIFK